MRLIDADQLIKDMVSNCSPTQFGRGTAKMMVKTAETIDPIRAAGGCYCRDCKYLESIEGSNDYCVIHETFCSKFCGDGKPREEQDDG